jgi:hypothetical protein
METFAAIFMWHHAIMCISVRALERMIQERYGTAEGDVKKEVEGWYDRQTS